MSNKRETPPVSADASGAKIATRDEQHGEYGADGGGGQAPIMESHTPTEEVHIFEMDFRRGWYWSLGDEHYPVFGPFASCEKAIRHAKLLVSPRPLIAEAGAKP